MSLALYWGSGSPYSWRCLLALTLKQLPFDSHRLEFSKGEHKSDKMLALNPRGKVPVLTDGEVTLYESVAIVAYLDHKHQSPALFGETPLDAATVWQVISEHDNYFSTAAQPLVRALFGAQPDADQLTKAQQDIEIELGRFNARLAQSPWLAGARVSAADIWVYPSVMFLDRMVAKQSAGASSVAGWRDRHPALATWLQRFAALPGVEQTTPPHWQGQ